VTPEKTMLLVGHPTEAVRKAKSLGLNVILFQHKQKFESQQAELADVTFLVDYTDWAVTRPLARAAQELWGFSIALSLTDPGLEVVGLINDEHGLAGTGFEVSRLFKNKWAMRRRLLEAGAATVGAELVADRDSMRAFGDQYGYPFIVKPIDLSGGFGVHRVSVPADIEHTWAQVVGMRETGMTRGPSALFTIGDFLMEEYASGPEYSVEAFSFSGRHVIVAVTEKLVDETHFAELGHTVPARLDSDTEQEIVGTVIHFLDVMGLSDGPSHTEIRVGTRGPVIIESHNRAGGDRIRDLVQAAYGFDFMTYAVGWPFRLVDELPDRPPSSGGACVRFLLGTPGRVEAISGIRELRSAPGVIAAEFYVDVGDTVRPLQDNFDRLGLVAVSGPDSDAAVRICEKMIAEVVDIQIADPAMNSGS
jgi:biotin carboxylase